MKPRRKSKPIRIGNVIVGGDAPVVVQSMTKTDTRNVMSTVRQNAAAKLSAWPFPIWKPPER